MVAQFCPFCGRPVATAGSSFCAYCGRQYPWATADQPGAGAANPFGAPPAQPISGGYAPNMMYGAPPYQQVQIIQRPATKSAGIAALLETFIPGAGAMYSEHVGVGVAWLIVTALFGVLIVVLSSAYAANQANSVYEGGTVDPSGYYLILGLGAVVGLIWYFVRLSIVMSYVRNYNAHAGGASSGIAAALGVNNGQATLGVTPGRLVGMGFLLAVIGYVLAYVFSLFVFRFIFFDRSLLWIIFTAAYWLSLARLPQGFNGRVCGEVVGVTAALGLIATLLEQWSFVAIYHTGFYFSFVTTVLVSISAAVVALVAFGLALALADWPTVRRLSVAPTSAASYVIAGVCVLVVTLIKAFYDGYYGGFYYQGLIFYYANIGFYAGVLLAIVFIVWASVGFWQKVQAGATRTPHP